MPANLVRLSISDFVYRAMRDGLIEAGYPEAVHNDEHGEWLDLQGFAIHATGESVTALKLVEWEPHQLTQKILREKMKNGLGGL